MPRSSLRSLAALGAVLLVLARVAADPVPGPALLGASRSGVRDVGALQPTGSPPTGGPALPSSARADAPATASARAGVSDLTLPMAPLAVSAQPQADLKELNAQAIAKTQAQLTKQTKRLAKREARQQKLLSKRAFWLAQLAQFEDDLLLAPTDLAAAEQALADAWALPADTAEQKQARKAAVKAAKAALKAAKKTLAKATLGVKRLTMRLAKLDAKLAHVAADIAEIQATLAALASDLDMQQQPFGFASLATLTLAGQLSDSHGVGIAHATVLLVDPLGAEVAGGVPDEPLSPAVHWRGFSQPDGSFGGALRLPGVIEQLDVIVAKPGYRGAYTHESLRELWGVYAPAARLTVDRQALPALSIELEIDGS